MFCFVIYDLIYRICDKSHICPLKAQTYQTEIKELTVAKVDCYVASCLRCLGQEAAFEHNAKTIADSQLAHTVSARARGNTAPYHQAAIICIYWS